MVEFAVNLISDEDPSADGLKATFYDSEFFGGAPLVNFADQVDFAWYGETPLEGISAENFSLM